MPLLLCATTAVWQRHLCMPPRASAGGLLPALDGPPQLSLATATVDTHHSSLCADVACRPVASSRADWAGLVRGVHPPIQRHPHLPFPAVHSHRGRENILAERRPHLACATAGRRKSSGATERFSSPDNRHRTEWSGEHRGQPLLRARDVRRSIAGVTSDVGEPKLPHRSRIETACMPLRRSHYTTRPDFSLVCFNGKRTTAAPSTAPNRSRAFDPFTIPSGLSLISFRLVHVGKQPRH